MDPKIGNNCYISPGVKIYDPICIGNDAVMGVHAVIGKFFEVDHITVGGIPAKLISNDGSEGMIVKGAK